VRFLSFHEFQDPRVLIFGQPVSVLILAKLHFQIVEPVPESREKSVTFRAFIDGRGGAGDQRPLRMFAEVENLIFQLIEFLMLQPHALTRLAVVDADLMPNRGRKIYLTFWAFQLGLHFYRFPLGRLPV